MHVFASVVTTVSLPALAIADAGIDEDLAPAEISPMRGPHATAFDDTCVLQRLTEPGSHCQRVLVLRAGHRAVEVHQIVSPDHHRRRMFVAIRDRAGWYESAQPLDVWTSIVSPMTSVTRRGTVTAIDARAVTVPGGPAALIVVHETWVLDCHECDAGYSVYATSTTTLCGIGPSNIPSCTLPFTVRAIGTAQAPEVNVSRGTLVIRGTDGDDGRSAVELP